ncbi:hypothetical protein K7887_01065 [Sutcliffiella horikoshii]|uniref:hypothetical protein n=1 Tax=Sutcliffiella horikoshii TaxID=79883 RepID=UPI001CBE0384|nr:hypothetical protein [Sutcliffiella horikoshii]UAL47614.1 hypothetical protein K7887_01065 [Sutcliffiella horikoshii]
MQRFLDTIQTFFFMILFLAITIITGISSFEFFRDGSILYGLALGVLCLFSVGFVWLSITSLLSNKD